jgi:DNA-binding NtrC family response regulator
MFAIISWAVDPAHALDWPQSVPWNVSDKRGWPSVRTKKKSGRSTRRTAAKPRRGSADHARTIADVLERFAAPSSKKGKITLHDAIDEFRRACILVALDANAKANSKTNMHATAQALGIARSYLYTLMEELDIRA